MLVPRMLVPVDAKITAAEKTAQTPSPSIGIAASATDSNASTKAKPAPARMPALPPRYAMARRTSLFAEALLENSPTRPTHGAADFVISMAVHTLLLAAVLLLPLYFTEALDLHGFTRTMLVAPPPAPPPPLAAAVMRATVTPKKPALITAKLVAPRATPNHIVRTLDAPAATDVAPGNSAGVPGGIPGGQPGGVIGGILSGASAAYVPEPPPIESAPKRPVRVGGGIKEPRLIARVDPEYPLLLQRARIEGEVVIDAIVDAQGNVVEMQPVSGHRLLIASAMEALRHWKYEPTILNRQPVPVELRVTFTFRVKRVS